jgi:DNA-binding transcriptional MerR regulator
VTTHTIGEVLNRLKDEFDDITISKIRFLEAEGLISPDRTESGYRKFGSADVERLRYVLRAQRDRYLPLKVIKEELRRIDAGMPEPAVEASDPDVVTSHDATSPLGVATADVALSAGELAEATGLLEADVAALVEHGLLTSSASFDGDELRITKLVADLLASGLEPRHLRMYRQFADREAALVEQLVAPLLRQRNPDSRRAATERAEHLTAIGGELHRALLAAQLRALLRS